MSDDDGRENVIGYTGVPAGGTGPAHTPSAEELAEQLQGERQPLEDSRIPSSGAQTSPVMVGSDDASNQEKVQGLIAQVRADHAGRERTDVLTYLQERFEQAQVDIDDERLGSIADEIAGL
jgi:hypothetical protein